MVTRLFLRVNSKDFYIERDWNGVVNKEVIFIFSNISQDAVNKCTEQHCHRKLPLKGN